MPPDWAEETPFSWDKIEENAPNQSTEADSSKDNDNSATHSRYQWTIKIQLSSE
jgi:hypothetical protein